ncbi:MAG: serine protease [Anaerolineae bacterium]
MAHHDHDHKDGEIDRHEIRDILPAVVQIVALNKRMFGNLQSAWTGSATIVDPRGYLLTNCHVANPRAMGMQSPAASKLGISIMERSDDPPTLTYYAEIVAQSPELDLAVLKITERVDGKSIRGLKLPYLQVGDSDEVELGDDLSIFGFPGIGGDTVTFTSGNVSGFTKQRSVQARRAFIKTDATIAGGNSGGTAVNHLGHLVAVPTQAAAGEGINPVDARPVVDTNRDGRIDTRDTPMAIGGFINGLRPVNLAKPLMMQAGVKLAGVGAAKTRQAARAAGNSPTRGSGLRKSAGRGASSTMGEMVFSRKVNRQGLPIGPSDIFPSRTTQLFATFDFNDMRNKTKWTQTWTHNGKIISQQEGKWENGPRGRMSLAFGSQQGLPDGTYHLSVSVKGSILAEGDFAVGRRQNDNDTKLSGSIVDARTKRGIGEALVIALKPGISARDFVRQQSPDMAYTSARTNRSGKFTFKKQLPRGQAYGLVVIARGYQDMAIEAGLRLAANTPEVAEMQPLPLNKG